MKILAFIIGTVMGGIGCFFLLNQEPVEEALGAATVNYQKDIIPMSDSLYYLGTTTKAWLAGYFDELCLTADTCRTTWPTGGSGSGGSNWTIEASGLRTSTSTDYAKAAYFIGTTTATSTFAGALDIGNNILTAHGAKAADSSGFHLHSSNGTGIAYFGVGGGSNSTFEGGVNIDGTTRLATGLSGLALLTSGTVSAATAGTDYEVPLTFGDGLTRTANDVDVDTTQNIAILSNLTSNGFVKTGSGNGTLSIDTTTYESGLTAGDGLTRTANDFDCDTASGSVFGCLSSTDWNTFNNKPSSQWLYQNGALTPSTTVGIRVAASSTIGGNTNASGLTILGGATTTRFMLQSALDAANEYSFDLVNTSAGVNGSFIATHHNSASPAALDYIGGWDMFGRDAGGVSTKYGQINTIVLNTTDAAETGKLSFGVITAGTYADELDLTGLDLSPRATDGLALGSTTRQFADLFLAEGGVLNWDNGDATLTQANNEVTLAGAGFNTTNATSTTSFFSALGTFTNTIVTTLATFLNVTITGLLDLGGGVLEIPNGAAPTVDSIGELALDSTSNQLVLYGTAKKVYGDGNEYKTFTYATSTAWTGTTTLPIGVAYVAETWNGVRCFTDVGTVNVDFGDGTNYMNATTSKALNPAPVHTLSSNNTFTAGETRYIRMGTAASSPTRLSCTVSLSLTSD